MTTMARDTIRPIQGRVQAIGKSAASDAADDIFDSGKAAARSVYGRIEERPLFSVLLALGLGVVAGSLLRPR